jgi:hypothetical protein
MAQANRVHSTQYRKASQVAPISLPTGSYDEVLKGEHSAMILNWHEMTVEIDKTIIQRYGQAAGKPMADVVSTLCYARVSKTAWSLCSLASIESGDFDPVEFGKQCERIARDQIEKYRTAFDQAGSDVRPDQRLRSVVSHLSLAARARGVLHWKAEFYPWAPRLSHRNLRREGNDYLCSATCHMGLFPIRKQHGRGRAPNVGASLVHWKLCEAGLRESRAERGQRPD